MQGGGGAVKRAAPTYLPVQVVAASSCFTAHYQLVPQFHGLPLLSNFSSAVQIRKRFLLPYHLASCYLSTFSKRSYFFISLLIQIYGIYVYNNKRYDEHLNK